MGNSNSTRQISAQDKAILDLKNQRDKLQQYQKRLAHLSSATHRLAKEAIAQNNKPRALLYIRQKKYHQSLVARTDAQLANLEQLVADVEFAAIQKDVFFGLKQGSEALKLINKEMGGLEAVQKVMEQTEEEVQFQRDVSDLLAGRMSRDEEEAAEEELEELEISMGLKQRDTATADVQGVDKTARLPNAPDKKPVILHSVPQEAAPLAGSAEDQVEEGAVEQRRRERQAMPA